MELTRRDALVAVAATSAGVTAAGEVAERIDGSNPPGVERVEAGLLAAADVVLPSVVDVDTSFLRTFVLGRAGDRDDYLESCAAALDELDGQSRSRFGRDFPSLSPARRERVLVDAGVQDVSPDPDGTALERVRYYVVNELLFALFASPTGGLLLDRENPPGYPGGRDAYQRGPSDE